MWSRPFSTLCSKSLDFLSSYGRFSSCVAFLLATLLLSPLAEAGSFTQFYLRGKLLYKQRLYVDAIKELNKAIKTTRGSQSFGAHYYLARAYFWRPNIQKAMETIAKAKELSKNKTQRAAYTKTVQQIRALYGKVTIVPEVDPDEVGRLLFSLKPKAAFSHKHKKRYYRILMKRIKKQGGIRPSTTLYLPKGEYEMGLRRDQCLQYGLFSEEKVARSLEVGDSDISINLKAQKSCQCPSNQIVIKNPKNPKKLTCSCAPGSVWDKKKNQCKKAKAPNMLPWILGFGIGGAALIGGAIGVVVAITTAEPTDNFLVTGPGWK